MIFRIMCVMEPPKIKKGEWIKIGQSIGLTGPIDGYVIDIYSDGTLGVGYYQNDMKAIKEEVIWNGEYWEFKCSGPNGSYLRGAEEAIVKRGPIY